MRMRARGADTGPEDDDLMIAAALTHSADIMQQQELYNIELKKGAHFMSFIPRCARLQLLA
jgi:hypothetical protein